MSSTAGRGRGTSGNMSWRSTSFQPSQRRPSSTGRVRRAPPEPHRLYTISGGYKVNLNRLHNSLGTNLLRPVINRNIIIRPRGGNWNNNIANTMYHAALKEYLRRRLLGRSGNLSRQVREMPRGNWNTRRREVTHIAEKMRVIKALRVLEKNIYIRNLQKGPQNPLRRALISHLKSRRYNNNEPTLYIPFYKNNGTYRGLNFLASKNAIKNRFRI